MILYDNQMFSLKNYGGITLYFSEVMQHLHDNNIHFEITTKETANENLKNRKYYKGRILKHIPGVPNEKNWIVPIAFPGKRTLYRIRYLPNHLINKYNSKKRFNQEIEFINKIFNENKKTIFHPTYYSDYYLNIIKKNHHVKLVLTIYDLIHERLNGYYSRDDMVLNNRLKLMLRADKIVAISESTKKDIIDIYGIDSKKIQVIHLCGSLNVKSQSNSAPYLKDYILYVGDRWSYKNFFNFLKSITPIVQKHKCLVLVAGLQPFSPEEIDFIEKLGIRGKVVRHHFSDDMELASLYANARLFVFPSLYEGFGIPLLEAMSQGCPVVCSNTSSFPEVVGNAAEMFDPWDVESMTHSIQKVFESDSLRNKMIDEGRKRADKFSWKKCGKEHVGVYEELSGKREA